MSNTNVSRNGYFRSFFDGVDTFFDGVDSIFGGESPLPKAKYAGNQNLFNWTWQKTEPFTAEFSSAFKFVETDGENFLEVEVPGWDEKDLKVKYDRESRLVTVSGEVTKDDNSTKNVFYQIVLPREFDNVLSANLSKGILSLKLEKSKKQRDRSVEIKIN